MLALPYAAAHPLCHCWRVSRSWPAAAHLRSAAGSARLFSSAPHAPLQSRLPWSARERACSSGARRALGVLGAAGACVLRRLRRAVRSERTVAAGAGRSGVAHGVTAHAVGSLHLIIGPMFAGKTTALLNLVQEHEARCMPRSQLPHVRLHSSLGSSGRRAAAGTWWWSSPTVTGATPRERWSATTACGGCASAAARRLRTPDESRSSVPAAMFGAATARCVARPPNDRRV